MDTSLNVVINKILMAAAKQRASYIHLTVGAYPSLRVDDKLVELETENVITNDFVKKIADDWLDDVQKKILEQEKIVTFTKEIGKKFRLKANFFFQKKFLSASLSLIPSQIPLLTNLGLPKSVFNLTEKKSGLVVIAGPFSSGKTTTVASIIEEINKSRKENIFVIEKPTEYLFINKKSLVEQQEVGRDVNSFVAALEYAQQADIDIVAVGTTSEREAIPLVLDFANSGRLAILAMDTMSVIQTIEEIFASFPANEKQRAQFLLAESLVAIVAQRLVPRIGGGLSLAAEVLIATEPVRSLIKEARISQITNILQTSRAEGMLNMDQSLADLVDSGEVLVEKAVEHASDAQNFRAMAKR